VSNALYKTSVVTVEILSGPEQGQQVTAMGRKFLIGRAEDCNLRLPNDGISLYHCAVLLDGYTVRLRDLASHNGMQVNGSPLQGECMLNDGDKVRIADVLLRIRIGNRFPQHRKRSKVLPVNRKN